MQDPDEFMKTLKTELFEDEVHDDQQQDPREPDLEPRSSLVPAGIVQDDQQRGHAADKKKLENEIYPPMGTDAEYYQ